MIKLVQRARNNLDKQKTSTCDIRGIFGNDTKMGESKKLFEYKSDDEMENIVMKMKPFKSTIHDAISPRLDIVNKRLTGIFQYKPSLNVVVNRIQLGSMDYLSINNLYRTSHRSSTISALSPNKKTEYDIYIDHLQKMCYSHNHNSRIFSFYSQAMRKRLAKAKQNNVRSVFLTLTNARESREVLKGPADKPIFPTIARHPSYIDLKKLMDDFLNINGNQDLYDGMSGRKLVKPFSQPKIFRISF